MLQNDNSKAIEYIDSIYDGYDIKQIKKYSNNKLINVIVSRYAQLCYNNNIEFSADIRDVNFSFIKDSEITALFDNLFENKVKVGTIKTQLGLSHMEFEGPRSAAIELFELIKNI